MQRVDFSARDVLQDILCFLTGDGIEYCLVGPQHGLDTRAQGDIDIIVSEAYLPGLPRKLAGFCAGKGFPVIQYFPHTQGFRFDIGWVTNQGDTVRLPLDFSGNLTFGMREIIGAEELLADRRIPCPDGAAPSHYVPAPAKEFAYYLLKKVEKCRMTHDQARHLDEQWRADPDAAREQLRRYWTTPFVGLVEQAARSGDWEPVRTQLPTMRDALHRRIGRSVPALWRSLRRSAHRAIRPAGFVVVLMIVDRADRHIAVCELVTRAATFFAELHHLQDPAFPAACETRGQGPQNNRKTSEGTAFARWFNRLALYLTTVRLKMHNRIIVIHRHSIHERAESEYPGTPGGMRWSARRIPKPDIVVHLYGYAPGPEQSSGGNGSSASPGEPWRGLVVDASRPMEEITKEIEFAVLAHLRVRTERRLRSAL